MSDLKQSGTGENLVRESDFFSVPGLPDFVRVPGKPRKRPNWLQYPGLQPRIRPRSLRTMPPREPITLSTKFPINTTKHGTELTSVVVGNGSAQKSFTLHKNLLCMASEYFHGALNDGFKETTEGLKLPNDCPVAFEIFYHWLYSGLIYEAGSYTHSNDILPEVLWLRVYKFADCRLIDPLMQLAYQKLRVVFTAQARSPVFKTFIAEVFDETGPEYLQRYMIKHCAYVLGNFPQAAYKVQWESALNMSQEFETAIGGELLQGRLGTRHEHPTQMPAFNSFRASTSTGTATTVSGRNG